MNFLFIIGLVIEFITLFSNAEAWPNWNWEHTTKHRPWNTRYDDRYEGCSKGHCVLARECPDHASPLEPTGHCAHLEDGPWVCCSDQDSSFANNPKVHLTKAPSKSFVTIPASIPKYSRTTIYKDQWVAGTKAAPRSRKSTVSVSSATTFSHSERKKENDVFMTTASAEVWSKISREKLSSPSYWKKTTQRAWNKPISGFGGKTTEVSSFEKWNKSTRPSKQTPGISSSTFQPKNKLTSNFWETFTTTKPKIKFITEIFNRPSSSSTKNKTRAIPPGDESSLHSRINSTQSLQKITTSNSWKQQPTRSTAKKMNTSTTRETGKATPKTTRPSQKKTSTMYSRFTSSTAKAIRTNQVFTESFTKAILSGGRSTPAGPKRDNPPKVGYVRTTASLRDTLDTNRRSTTKKYRVTTPLPDINNHYCGIREQQTSRNQPGRNNRRANSGTTVIFKDSRENEGRRPFQRIVGGREAEPFSWPWVAALYKVSSSGGNRFLSAGTLINEHFVLTAAHVFTPDDLRTSSYVVMLGTHTAKEAFGEYSVSSVLQHPDYQHRYYYNDIALLKLERPVRFNDYVMPICLPSPDASMLRDRDLVGRNVTVMGWGDDSFGGKSSRVLKEATFPIVSRQACNASYVQVASNRFPKGITDQMLCAGAPNGGKDACQGDSGGPLTTLENGRYTQVGIVSFGYKCGDKEFPGVYTKVSTYLDWIAENTLHTNIVESRGIDY